MEMMRKACVPKSGVSVGKSIFSLSILTKKKKMTKTHFYNLEMVDGLREGQFPDVKELKCYTLCVAQMGGTVSV